MYDRIEQILRERGLSRRQLAKLAGIPPTTLQSALERRKNLTVEMAISLATALNIDVNWLINGYTLDERRQAMVDYAKNRRVEVQAEKQILDGLQLLNAEGKKKIADYIDDLIKSGKYQIQRSKALDGIRLEVYGDGPAGNFPPKPDTSSAQEGGNNIAINPEDDE